MSASLRDLCSRKHVFKNILFPEIENNVRLASTQSGGNGAKQIIQRRVIFYPMLNVLAHQTGKLLLGSLLVVQLDN